MTGYQSKKMIELVDQIIELKKEIERLRKQNQNQALDFIASEGEWCEMTDKKNKEIERLREALQKIADLEHEDLTAPKSPAEAVLWVCLDRCVTLAETALKEKE